MYIRKNSGVNARILIKLLFIALVVALLVVANFYLDLQSYVYTFLLWMEGRGFLGMLLFVLLYVLMTVLLLPGSLLTILAGFIFGFGQGFVLVSIASTLGAFFAFIIGRYLARAWVEKKIQKLPTFKAIHRAISEDGWVIVGLLRLSPIVPFNLSNYFFGITRVSVLGYTLASWICMMPGTMLYVYLGSLSSDLALIGQGQERGALEWALYILGLIATVVACTLVIRKARKAIAERIEEDPA